MTIDFKDLATIISLFSLFVAIGFPLFLKWREGRERFLQFQIRQEQINRTAEETLHKSETILREVQEVTAAHHVRPELSTYFAKQWRFIEKTFHSRYEKHAICRRIVSHYIENNSTVLLDSGSTIDLVTFGLLTSNVNNVKVCSNNLFAAMHLIGTRKVRFHLFSGWFDDIFAAVYDDESTARISGLPVDLYVLAATTIRFSDGIMVLNNDTENREFKAAALKTFQRSKSSTLLIAVDASKFIEPIQGKQGVLPINEWQNIIEEEYQRIVVITSRIREDVKIEDRNAIESEIARFRAKDIRIEYGIDPTEDG